MRRSPHSSSSAQLEALFDLDYHLKHVDTMFTRVFGSAD